MCFLCADDGRFSEPVWASKNEAEIPKATIAERHRINLFSILFLRLKCILWQSKSDIYSSTLRPALGGFKLAGFPPTGRDYDKLAPINLISGGRSISGEGQRSFPKQLARLLVEGAELLVKVSRRDKN